VTLPVTVQIAGRTAQLLYAGSAPGNVNGFCQVNAIVPLDLQYGGNLPLTVQIGGVSSQTGVTVAVSGSPAPIPGAPQNLTASVNVSGQVVLGWTPADSVATRVHIERQFAGNEFTEIALIKATTTFTDANVTVGTTYEYRIRAENDYGFSPYSAVVTTMVPAPQLSPPTNLQAAALSLTQINLMWSNTNTNATRFHIERRIATGTYIEITAVPATATNYQDTALQANTAYTYRARSEGASGFSGYSNESSAATPALPLPPAPTLQAAATSALQVHLSWSSTATGVVRFRLERRTATGNYGEISQLSATSTAYDDSGVTGSTGYFYRVRVETAAGVSPYSNEVAVTTFPNAPTNLQGTAISSSQISLTWTNNSPDATAIRVESQPSGSTSFTDIGPAGALTDTGVTNLQPNTTYSFRVGAQSSVGYSAYSNVAAVTTLPIPKTIFLIHGIGQSKADVQGLYSSLTSSSGIDLTRFRVNAGFDFSECAATDFCSSSCSISSGAQKLAQHIADANPPGDIILIGFSMGGLLARDLMANGRLILNGRRISALITLGTPNLGYPYTFVDTALFCTQLVQEMNGNWRSQQATNTVVLSSYLYSLVNQWPSASYPGSASSWMAASGRSCSDPIRTIDATTGCRDKNPYSDGVVCDDSATYFTSTPSGTAPNSYWQDPSQIYVHSNYGWGTGSSLVLCGNSGNPTFNPPLSNPPVFGPLFAAIKGLINGLH
jgi:pimeloyl-ACP methyl ester carboxylesterase